MKQKFRAWDKKENKWVDYPIYIDANGDVYWENYERGLQEADDLIVMQYTGLDDKNGLGIFEKDIVKIRVDVCFNYIDGIGFVDWYEKKREYAIFSKGEPWIPLSIEGEIEVIGDIYQNKDLLEGLL